MPSFIPDSTKRLRGTQRPDRVPRKDLPERLLRPPRWLDEAAKAVWREVAPLLAAHGLTTVLDSHTLARYAVAEGRRRQAEIENHTTVAVRYSRLADHLSTKLGLDPLSRQRLPVKAPKTAADRKHEKYFRSAERFFGDTEQS